MIQKTHFRIRPRTLDYLSTCHRTTWADITAVGVSQWAADTMGIRQEKGGLTTPLNDNEVRESVGVIDQSMSISNVQGTGPEQCDVLHDHCVTRIRSLASTSLHSNWYLADKTHLDGQRVKAALDEFGEVGLGRRKNGIDETPTTKMTFIHIGMYFIAQMLCSLFLIM